MTLEGTVPSITAGDGLLCESAGRGHNKRAQGGSPSTTDINPLPLLEGINEVQGQRVSGLGFTRGLAPRLADSRLLSCPHVAFPLCAHIPL